MITKEHYRIAEANGLSKNLVRMRVSRGWSIEDAIHKPKDLHRCFSDKELALLTKNRIATGTAWARIHILGWTREWAVTEPVLKRRNNIL